MNECLFCKIINKDIPAEIIYEDDYAIAFLDINPVNPGHVLIMPKEHKEFFWELDDAACSPISTMIRKVMKSIVEGLGYEGVNLIQNNGTASGQVIPHVHFHVIPRKTGDGHAHWHGKGYESGEGAIWGAKLREALNKIK